MKRILILGATGFSGRHLIEYLVGDKCNSWEIIGADSRNPTGTFPGQFHALDALDRDAVADLVFKTRPDAIVNLIGAFNASSWDEYFQINVEISHNLLDGVLNAGLTATRILLIGSAAEYGKPRTNPIKETDELRPVSLYGLSKAIQTQLGLFYADTKGMPVVFARTFNITGSGISPMLSVGSFAKQIAEARDGGSIAVGNLGSERDFLPIEEVVRRYAIILLNGKAGLIYNVCSGKPITMKKVVERMISESGKRLRLEIDQARVKAIDVSVVFGDSSRYDELELEIMRSPKGIK